MIKWLRTLPYLAEDLSSMPVALSGSSQPPVPPVPEDVRSLAFMGTSNHIHTHFMHIYITKNKSWKGLMICLNFSCAECEEHIALKEHGKYLHKDSLAHYLSIYLHCMSGTSGYSYIFCGFWNIPLSFRRLQLNFIWVHTYEPSTLPSIPYSIFSSIDARNVWVSDSLV